MKVYNHIQSKIRTREDIMELVEVWKQAGEQVVFTNGCFDLIHRGHVDYLAKARDLGHRLIVALNTDRSVAALKGPHRPLQDEQSRLQIMASFAFTDAVILFDEDTPLDLISYIIPDVLVKGADYIPEQIVGYEVVTSHGGNVVTLEFLPGYSTSAIEQKIRTR